MLTWSDSTHLTFTHTHMGYLTFAIKSVSDNWFVFIHSSVCLFVCLFSNKSKQHEDKAMQMAINNSVKMNVGPLLLLLHWWRWGEGGDLYVPMMKYVHSTMFTQMMMMMWRRLKRGQRKKSRERERQRWRWTSTKTKFRCLLPFLYFTVLFRLFKCWSWPPTEW